MQLASDLKCGKRLAWRPRIVGFVRSLVSNHLRDRKARKKALKRKRERWDGYLAEKVRGLPSDVFAIYCLGDIMGRWMLTLLYILCICTYLYTCNTHICQICIYLLVSRSTNGRISIHTEKVVTMAIC